MQELRDFTFKIKSTGDNALDRIISEDEEIKVASNPPNLLLLDKRIDKLKEIHSKKD